MKVRTSVRTAAPVGTELTMGVRGKGLSSTAATSERSFFINAQYEGGISVPISELEDIENVLPIIRQARDLVQ